MPTVYKHFAGQANPYTKQGYKPAKPSLIIEITMRLATHIVVLVFVCLLESKLTVGNHDTAGWRLANQGYRERLDVVAYRIER